MATLEGVSSGSGVVESERLQNTATAANNNGVSLTFAANRTTSGLTNIAAILGLITDISTSAYKGALAFSTADNAAPAERMRIDRSGNVGIGTSSPAQKLSVAGVIESTTGGVKFPDGSVQTTDATAFTQTGTGAAARTVSSKLRDSVSIADFGATTASSDNATAIQNAINEMNSRSAGGTVWIPDGEFVSGVISLKSNVTLRGYGWGSRLKCKSGINTSWIIPSGSGYVDNVHVVDLQLDGNGGANSAGTMLQLRGRKCSVERCYFHDGQSSAVYVGGDHTNTPLAGDVDILDNLIVDPNVSGASITMGIAIVFGSNIRVSRNTIASTNGYMTAGIGIEPNNSNDTLDDVTLEANAIRAGRILLDCGNMTNAGTQIRVVNNRIDVRGTSGTPTEQWAPIVVRAITGLQVVDNYAVGHPDSAWGSMYIHNGSAVSGVGISRFQIANNVFFPQANGTSRAIHFEPTDGDNIATDGVFANNFIYALETVTHGFQAVSDTSIARVTFDGNRFFNVTNDYSIGTESGYVVDGAGVSPRSMWTTGRTWNPGTVNDGTTASTTLTLKGVLAADDVWVGATFPALPAGVLISASVTANETVTVTLRNQSGGNVTLSSQKVRIVAFKFQNSVYY